MVTSQMIAVGVRMAVVEELTPTTVATGNGQTLPVVRAGYRVIL